MKFRVERDVLAEAVTWAARGLPTRPPVPVLAGVLLEAATDGTLTLSAFDYEVSARVSVAAEVDEAGTVLVSGRLLADISRNLPSKPVDVATEGQKVQVTCGGSRFSLLTMPVDDYPTLPTMPEATGTVPGDVFTLAVSQVTTAAGRDDTLPILTGVRVEIDGSRMTLLATDRYRLAMRTLDWNPGGSDAAAVALVPARTLADTAKALGASASVDLALGRTGAGDGLVGFEAGSRRTTSRLLDGEYPKVTAIFPTTTDVSAVVETASLVEAVKRVALVAERNTPVRLRFTDGQPDHRGRAGRRRAGEREHRGAGSRAARSRSRSTRSTCSTAWAPCTSRGRGSRSRSRRSPRCSPGRARPTPRRTTASSTCSCRSGSRA
nr:DNA polymerase III subunit beta [Angustibacter aerolatus]